MDKDILKRAMDEENQEFDEDTRNEAIETLKSWVEESSDAITCRKDDKFLLSFLRMNKFDIMEAKKMVTNFCACCKAVPKFITNLDIYEPTLDTMLSSRIAYLSPYRDSKGRPVLIVQLGAVDTSLMNYVDVTRLFFTELFTILDDPVSQFLGYLYVIDLGRVGPAHVTFWSAWDIIKLFRFSTNAIPVRHKEIHVINMNSVIKALFALATSVLPKKIKGRICVHNSLEDLHSRVCPDLLPMEYGGSMPATEMCNLWKEKMREARDIVFSMSDTRQKS